MKKIIVYIIVCLLLTSCKNFNVTSSSFDSNKEINIIFTSINDVSSIKEEYINNTPNLTVLGCGDAKDGIGFDYYCVGKNEFKDGINAFYEKTKKVGFKYLACNLSYNGKIKDIFKNVDPYVIVNYDGIKIGYVGVVSPLIKESLNNNVFMENDNIVVNFYDEECEVLYDTVKEAVVNVREEGVDYVVLLTYLGSLPEDSPYSSYDLINNICDVDIVLDGNCKELIEEEIVKDTNNNDVILCGFDNSYNGYGLIKIDKENISVEFK